MKTAAAAVNGKNLVAERRGDLEIVVFIEGEVVGRDRELVNFTCCESRLANF